MRNRIGTTARVLVFAFAVAANWLAWTPATARAEEEHWGQCEYFGTYPNGHCHCVDPVTTTNCSNDGNCNFGICGAS